MKATARTDPGDPRSPDAAGLFRAVFEQAAVGVAQTETATGRYFRVNQRYCDIVGYSREEMERLDFQTLTHPDDLAADLDNLRRLVAGEIREFSIEKRYRHKEGRAVWVNLTVSPLWAPGEPPNFHIAVVQDITGQKRDQEALQRSEEMFRRTFDLSPVGAVVVGLDHRFIRCNEAFCRFLGYAEAELLGRTFLDVTFPKDREIGQPEISALVAGSLDRAQVRKRYLRKDGGGVWGEVSISLVRDAHGQPLFFLTIIQDVTERQRAEAEKEKLQAQLLQAQKMESVGRLAGGVAHDFNNMLQAILGNAALALQDLPPDSPLCENLEEIQKSAQRSADLTRQLLAFARKQTIQPKVLDLNDTVAGMLKMLRRLIGEDIDLAWLPGADLWPVKADPSQVDQILANLCVNARDAITDTGKVSIETANVTLDDTYARTHPDCAPGDYVMLAVSDTGQGMDDETRAHLFEPFFTTKELGKGTGLGLATVFGIVKQNRGLINVYSEPGQGTTFKIYLPRVEAEAVVAAQKAVHRSLRGTETVLLVEDEEQILNLGRRILAQQDYTVLVASTPEVALVVAARHAGPIHLLITDVVMPGMNGKELRERLRTGQPQLKCLFMSGYTANVIAHHGVLEDGVQFLQKPFTIQTLAEKVREVLEQAMEP